MDPTFPRTVIAALAWGVAAGCLARLLFRGDGPGLAMTLTAGFGGSVLGYLVAHEMLGLHQMHLFSPEGLLPASAAALGLLSVGARLRRATRRRSMFN